MIPERYAGYDQIVTVAATNFLGHSTIAGPAFPAFSKIYAEAGETE